MKRCPRCQHSYADDNVKFCRLDGTALVDTESLPTAPFPSTLRTRTTLQLDRAASIAVLPFANLSTDLENDYFCDGLAEELLNALAKIEDLKVAARTSAFSFKNSNTNVSEIGRILNVEKVLMGGVRKSGNRIRITVQLVDATTGYSVWSERFDRELQDVFAVQDEITRAVVEQLKIKLFGDQAQPRPDGDDTEAYQLYLKGLFHFRRYTGAGWARAVQFFEQAIEKSPEYAAAFSGLAQCRMYLYYYSIVPPETVLQGWLDATNRALSLDDSISEAHLSLANYYFYYQRDRARAEQEFERALRLNPNSADAHQFYGLFLIAQKRFDEGVREGRRALELDPLSLLVNLHLGWINWFALRFGDALQQIERMLDLDPKFFGAYWLQGSIQSAAGDHATAIASFEKAFELGGDVMLSFLGSAHALAGHLEEALAIIDRLLELRERQFTSAFNLARVYGGLNDTEKTFEWLQKSLAEHNGELVYFEIASNVVEGSLWGKDLRSDPRYIEFIKSIQASRSATD